MTIAAIPITAMTITAIAIALFYRVSSEPTQVRSCARQELPER